GRKPFSDDLATQQGAARFASSAAASSSVGAHAHTNTKLPAGHGLGEWSTARSKSLELRWTGENWVLAASATRRVSAQCVADDVPEHGIGDREADKAGGRASGRSFWCTTADDPSWSGAGYGAGDGSIPGRSTAVCG